MSLIQAGSLSARKPENGQVQVLTRALQHFQDRLSSSERAELKDEDVVPDANAAIAFTAELDRNPSRRGPSIASRLHNVLQSVWEFTTVVDTFVSSRPEIAALVWGSIKFTMKLVMNYTSYFEQLSRLFMRLTSFCPRFVDYQALFPNSKPLQDALCKFYATLVGACEHMIQVAQRSGMQQAWNLLCSFEAEFKSDEEEIKERGRDVRIAVEFAKMKSDEEEKAFQREEREKQSKIRRLVRRSMKTTESNMDSIKYHQATRDIERSSKRKRTLIEDLTCYDHTAAYKDASKKRHSGTAEWVFETPAFLQWKASTSPSIIFCTGKIGSGKTVLAANVVARQLALRKREEDSFAFFFVRHDSPESRKADVILRSIVKQCMRYERLTEELMKQLEDLHSNPCPSMDDIIDLMREQQPPSHSETFTFLIDGLNELEIGERRCLLNSLMSLHAHIPHLKIFLCGQESLSAELSLLFPNFIPLSMSDTLAESDIALFVRAALHERHQSGFLVVNDTSLLQDIIEVLTGHADGMFLWVTYLMDDICTHQKDKDIRKALQNLPKSLEETFDRALLRIVANQKAELVLAIFQWVAIARRNLTLDELREAISLEIGQSYLSGEDLVNGIRNVASWCENLVQVDEELGFTRFAHFSIHEYITNKRAAKTLSRFHFDMDEVDDYAGEICITYLNLSNFTTTITKRSRPFVPPNLVAMALMSTIQSKIPALGRIIPEYLSPRSHRRPHPIANKAFSNFAGNKHDGALALLENYPFLEYAKAHWLSHTKSFTEDKSKTWKLWADTIINEDRPAQIPWNDNPIQAQSRHQWAYNNSHYALMTLCLANGELSGDDLKEWVSAGVTQKDHRLGACRIPEALHICSGTSEDALVWATLGGNVEIIDSIINAGAYIDALSSQLCQTPLSMASATGNLELTEHLLDCGAAINAHSGRALPEASQKGLLRVIDQLKDIPMSSAVRFGVEQYSESTGASTNERLPFDPLDEESLDIAFETLHFEVIKCLLASGADINAGKDIPNGTILCRAAEAGQLGTVDYLLLSGADVNAGADNEYGTTALCIASASGHIQVVERILKEPFVSINALSLTTGTAICGASRDGHLEIVNKLIEAGANVNVGERGPEALKDSTPLCLASHFGHIKIVDLLVEAGAIIEGSTNDSLGTPLCRASRMGHLLVVERLLAAGADVNARSPMENKTPLHWAARGGHYEILQRLLEVGADINAHDISHDTALHVASQNRHNAIYLRLVEAGADIRGQTPPQVPKRPMRSHLKRVNAWPIAPLAADTIAELDASGDSAEGELIISEDESDVEEPIDAEPRQ